MARITRRRRTSGAALPPRCRPPCTWAVRAGWGRGAQGLWGGRNGAATELLAALQVRVDQRTDGRGAVREVDVGRSDALGVEVLGQACHLAEAGRRADDAVRTGAHCGGVRSKGQQAGATSDLCRFARPVEAFEHDKCTALQAAPRHGFLSTGSSPAKRLEGKEVPSTHYYCTLLATFQKPPAKALEGIQCSSFSFDRRFRIPWLEALRGGERRRC